MAAIIRAVRPSPDICADHDADLIMKLSAVSTVVSSVLQSTLHEADVETCRRPCAAVISWHKALVCWPDPGKLL